MRIFNSRKELYDYLNNFDFNSKSDTELSSVYFLMEFNNHTEPIYFTHFQDSWFESPCVLYRFPLKDDEVMEYTKEMYRSEYVDEAYEYELLLQKDGWHYEIDVPQCKPFIPAKSKIIQTLSEEECMEWLLKHSEW